MRVTMREGCLLRRNENEKNSSSDAHMTRHALTSLLLISIPEV